MNKITLISTSASEISNSRKLIPFIEEYATQLGLELHIEEIRNYTPVWVNNRQLSDYPIEYSELATKIANSGGILFVTPVYCYSLHSAVKVILEICGSQFKNKPVGFIVSAGSLRSHLAVSSVLNSLLFDQAAHVYQKQFMVTGNDFEQEVLAMDYSTRLFEFLGGFDNYINNFAHHNMEEKG